MIAREEGVVKGLWRGVGGVRSAREFIERVAVGDVRRREAVFVAPEQYEAREKKTMKSKRQRRRDVSIPVQGRRPTVTLHLRVHLRRRRANRNSTRGHVENFSHVLERERRRQFGRREQKFALPRR